MTGRVESVFVARELIVRTGRHLVVIALPLVCWLAGQESPAQALLAWAVQRGTALLATARAAARATENFDHSVLSQDAFDEINCSGSTIKAARHLGPIQRMPDLRRQLNRSMQHAPVD
jgi:hypothetical protein